MEENPRPDNNLPEPTPNNNQNFQKLIQDYIKYLNNQRSSGNWLPYVISIAIFLIFPSYRGCLSVLHLAPVCTNQAS